MLVNHKLPRSINMRIFGVGVDIAHVPRFERCFARHGDRFLRRAFHPSEIREFYGKPLDARPSFLASRSVGAFGALRRSLGTRSI